MMVSGAESVVAAASPFLGAGEAAVLIKQWLPHLTDAEMHQIQVSGFSTVAGSVLFAYMAMGVSGKVVLSSCVMSIPASLALSKLRWPETHITMSGGQVEVPQDEAEDRPRNWLQALADGIWLGLKVAGMILAAVLTLVSLVALVNGFLAWWGGYLGASNLSLQLILGYLLWPVSALTGCSQDPQQILAVAELIGEKIIVNEFVAVS